jgi:AcrR family transcriptional regulator
LVAKESDLSLLARGGSLRGVAVAVLTPEPRQARSRATRRRLLRACVASLAERGLAATTTTEVCRRARVSQGALFKHFPSKHALLAAAVEDLFSSLVAEYRRGLEAVSGSDDRVAAAVRLLWEIMTRRTLHAVYELMVASRGDATLRRALEAVQLRHRDNLRLAARELFPRARAGADFDAMLDVVLSALQGASLGGLVLPDADADERRLEALTALARRVLG